MNIPYKDLVIGVVAGYVLKAIWSSTGLWAGINLPIGNIRIAGTEAVAGAVVIYGLLKQRRLVWIGIAMFGGAFLRNTTSPAT